MIQPLNHRVAIVPDEAENKTVAGIIELMDKEEQIKGVVVAVGENVDIVEKGQKVIFQPMRASEYEYNDMTVIMTHQDDILAVYEED